MKYPYLNRRSFVKASAAIGAASILAPLSTPLLAAQERGIVGALAPELKVPYWIDGQGKKTAAFSLAANKGKWIFLKCFQNWCPGCHSSGFPTLQKVTNAFKDNDKVVTAAIQTTFEGFSTNTQDALRKNQLRYELEIPFGHDQGDENADHGDFRRFPSTMLEYRTGGTPWITVINPEGVVVFNDFHVNGDKLIAYLQEQTQA